MSGEREVWRGKMFQVVQEEVLLGDGRRELREWIARPDGARIIAVDEAGRVLLIRERRDELGGRPSLKLPGGRVDREVDPSAAALRELREETGFDAARIEPLFVSVPFSTVRYRIHVFVAHDLRRAPLAGDEAEGAIEVVPAPLDEACRLALEGAIEEPVSALALLRFRHSASAVS